MRRKMRRRKELCLAILVVMVAFNIAQAQTFQERPITKGLRGLTAYPLNGGEVQIGDLLLPLEASQLHWLAIDLGVTRNLQVGTALPANFLGTLNLLAKYRFLRLARLSLTLPLSLNVALEPRTLILESGLIVSWALNENFSSHSGVWVVLTNEPRFALSTLYVIIDVNVLANTKLLLELDIYPLAVDPVWISLGELRRFGPLNLTVTATLALPSTANTLEAGIFFRF